MRSLTCAFSLFNPCIALIQQALTGKIAHVPDVTTFNGLLDLFSVCNLVELSNIIHPQTYTTQSLDPAEHYDMVQACKKTQTIIEWIFSHYEFEGDVSIESFYWCYLAYQAWAICFGKEYAEEHRAYSYSGEAFGEQMCSLVKYSFKEVKEFWPIWESYNGVEPNTFAWPSDVVY